MADVTNTLIYSSIILIVVVQLTESYGDTDLVKMSHTRRGLILLLLNLGTFSLVHAVNVFLLETGFLLALVTWFQGDELSITLLLVAYISFIVILPFLEIDGYVDHLESSVGSWSYTVYVVSSFAVMVGFPAVSVIAAYFGIFDVGQDLGIILLYAGLLGSIWVFLWQLDNEYRMN